MLSEVTLDQEIQKYIADSAVASPLNTLAGSHTLMYVVKFTNARYVASIENAQMLHASHEEAFTWGDAVYVTPLAFPKSTMMYGDIGMIGTIDISSYRTFDATKKSGKKLYQRWIAHPHRALYYDLLTTTVHSRRANRQLRNAFRTMFHVDCVVFRPDEVCAGYVDESADYWLAITHWNAVGEVGYGPTPAIADLKWCIVNSEAFEKEAIDYKAHLQPVATGRSFFAQSYVGLEHRVRTAHTRGNEVIIPSF